MIKGHEQFNEVKLNKGLSCLILFGINIRSVLMKGSDDMRSITLALVGEEGTPTVGTPVYSQLLS